VFRAVIGLLADDFRRGWSHVWDVVGGSGALGIYRGLGQTAVATRS
jgi:hypothetical protein